MKPKRKISRREVWLVSLLPAALVVIVSFALPGPADEISTAERRLTQLTNGDAHERMHSELGEFSTQLRESRRALAELETREVALETRIRASQTPRATRTLAMAETLDELTRRLAGHDVMVLAMVEDEGSSAKSSDWQLSVAASWSAMRGALADDQTFPQGLALSALKMESPRPNVSLQRWELIVADIGAMP